MAIDTAEKRRSAAGVSVLGMLGGSVTPNAAKDVEWRQQAGWSYSGIAPGNPATLLVDAVLLDQDTGYRLVDTDTGYTLREAGSTQHYVIKRVN